jgi:hypothetical protein
VFANGVSVLGVMAWLGLILIGAFVVFVAMVHILGDHYDSHD